MLFKLEVAVRLGYTSSSCTSEACQWNATFLKNVSAAPISDIIFYKDNYGSKSATKKKKTVNAPSQVELDNSLLALKTVSPKSVLLSAFDEHCDNFIDKTPQVIEDAYPVDLRTYFGPNTTSDQVNNSCQNILKKLYDVTETQRKNICKVTVSQSSSPQWFRYRAGRITSSTAHNLLRTSLDKPSQSAVLGITTLGSPSYLGPAVQHGNKYEQTAIDAAVSHMRKSHINVNYSKTGLTISSEIPYICASPDFLLSCDCCGEWVGEAKCPYSHKDELIGNISDPKFSLENDNLNKTHQHYTQVQIHMYCTGIDKCLYVVWTFKDYKVITVAKDEDFTTSTVSNLTEKYEKIILPEIVTRKSELKKLSCHKNACGKENSNKVFCFCNGPETPQMIGCDNPECTTGNQWFHFSCIKMKRPPKGKWLCPVCTKSSK
jgi:hypothetical protein